MERRLTAILVADMVSYSRLMEADELGTIQRQGIHRTELIDPELTQHQGRVIKTTGDGLLAEFPSVVAAVDCAVQIQRAMALREADMPEQKRIAYRIGINLGDVFHENGDVHGDGVNVAARLEQMADPGGICISGSAHEHLRATIDVGYEDLGKVQVKNIQRPIRAWRVLLDPEHAGVTVVAASGRTRVVVFSVIAAGILIAAMATGGWWWSRQPEFPPADPDRYAFELPQKPSIAVLAFDNLSGDQNSDYLGEGLSENIIATLAAMPKLFVIARNSSFHYQGKATPVQTIAEELGVRYVLEGSVQRAGDEIRVTAQLIDALDGRHIWAGTYDRALSVDDLFTVQDSISRDIALTLDLELISGRGMRGGYKDLGDLDALLLTTRAIAEYQKFSPAGNQLAEELLLQAMKINPNSSGIHVNLGWVTWYKIPLGQSRDPAATLAKARAYAQKAIDLDPNAPWAHSLLGFLAMSAGDHDSALKHAEKSVDLSPGGGIVASTNGLIYSVSGYPERGVQLLRYGMRTEPYYPDWVAHSLAQSLMMLSQYDEAKEIFKDLMEQANPQISGWATSGLAVIAVWEGDIKTARHLVAPRLEANPGYSVVSVRRHLHNIYDTDFVERFVDALRQAGVPENPLQ